MEKLSRERIIEIANSIFESSDVIAKHGTSVAKATSILETGFYYDKTSMAIQYSKNVVALCSYGWKESYRNDSTNVVLAIPKSFIKMINGFSDEEYLVWLSNIQQKDLGSGLFYASSKVVEEKDTEFEKQGKFTLPRLPKYVKAHIPKEFVKGFFVWCDGKISLDFLSNPEDSLDHLSYVENPAYFDNLSLEEQEQFVADFKGEKRKQR